MYSCDFDSKQNKLKQIYMSREYYRKGRNRNSKISKVQNCMQKEIEKEEDRERLVPQLDDMESDIKRSQYKRKICRKSS